MATIPYGGITKTMAALKTMLSYSASFQRWVETTDAAIPVSGSARADFCLDYIKLGIAKRPDDGWVWPLAVITDPLSWTQTNIAEGAGQAIYAPCSGMMQLSIFRGVPDAFRNDIEGAFIDFGGADTDGVKTGIGTILEDLMNLDDSIPILEAFRVVGVDGPAFLEEEVAAGERGDDIMRAIIDIGWGVDG